MQIEVNTLELINADCGLCQGAYFAGCGLCRGTNVVDLPVTDDLLCITLNNVQLALLQSLPNCTIEESADPKSPFLVQFDGGVGLDYSGTCVASTL